MTPPASSLSWLLEAETPSIRYLAQTRLRDLPADDPQVAAARRDLYKTGPVPALLVGQSKEGNWQGERSYYTPKYTSTHWAMLLLAELGVDAADSSMHRGAGFMLKDTQRELASIFVQPRFDLECFWGNLLRYAIQAGYQDDLRIAFLIEYLIRSAIDGGWRCPHNDDQPCAWGAARVLWGLAAVERPERYPRLAEAVASGLRFLLEEHSLLEANYPSGGERVSQLWFKLNFPLFYQADILFVLRVLAELGRLDHSGAQPALRWLASQRAQNGRFSGSSPFRRRTYPALGGTEETKRWVTLQAEWVLKTSGVSG